MVQFVSEPFKSKAGQVPELQTLRGLAAILVLLQHCAFYIVDEGSLRLILEAVLNAHAAVVIFFVLSGYVLTRSLCARDLTIKRLLAFYVRRAFRIFPALWGASILALVVVSMFLDVDFGPFSTAFARASYNKDYLSVTAVLLSFAGLSVFLVPPIWTIRIELLGSLVIPIAASTRGKVSAFLVVLVVFSVLSVSFRSEKVIYLMDFVLGGGLAIFPLGRFRVRPLSARIIAICSCFLLLSVRELGDWRFQHNYHSHAPAFLEALAATVLIGVIVENRGAFNALNGRVGLFFGDISYSLYLLHFPLLVGIARAGQGQLAMLALDVGPLAAAAVLSFITMGLTTFLAWISYNLLERPGIELGSLVTGWLGLSESRSTVSALPYSAVSRVDLSELRSSTRATMHPSTDSKVSSVDNV
ncbi:acyltransferase family protein [Bradyrhizobium lupini]